VTIKFAAAVDMTELLTYVSGRADPHADVPRAAIQVLEVVMRSGVAGGCGKGEGEVAGNNACKHTGYGAWSNRRLRCLVLLRQVVPGTLPNPLFLPTPVL
jgi:hypothetical protein